MSAIKRQRRAMRAALLRELAVMESDAIKAGQRELAAKIIEARGLLEAINRATNRSGAEKDRIFRRVARELKEAIANV